MNLIVSLHKLVILTTNYFSTFGIIIIKILIDLNHFLFLLNELTYFKL